MTSSIYPTKKELERLGLEIRTIDGREQAITKPVCSNSYDKKLDNPEYKAGFDAGFESAKEDCKAIGLEPAYHVWKNGARKRYKGLANCLFDRGWIAGNDNYFKVYA